jgi:catechol 2,3-dioxygenase-like lactoylglutathione lyase family enzyme
MRHWLLQSPAPWDIFSGSPDGSGRQNRRPLMTDAAIAAPEASASDTIRTKGILHFTIGVRDHLAAAKFYSEVLGCRHMRSTERYAFMECGGSYFVLAKSSHHVPPNDPGEETHHHAFIVDKDEFDRALAIMKARGIPLVSYSDQGHITFPGRHAYFHDADGNCIEIIDYVKK